MQSSAQLKAKFKSWLWELNYERSLSSGSYGNVIDASYDVPCTGSHLHRCDAQPLPLFLLYGWSAVTQRAISSTLGSCFIFQSGQQLTAANRDARSSKRWWLLCFIFFIWIYYCWHSVYLDLMCVLKKKVRFYSVRYIIRCQWQECSCSQ